MKQTGNANFLYLKPSPTMQRMILQPDEDVNLERMSVLIFFCNQNRRDENDI